MGDDDGDDDVVDMLRDSMSTTDDDHDGNVVPNPRV